MAPAALGTRAVPSEARGGSVRGDGEEGRSDRGEPREDGLVLAGLEVVVDDICDEVLAWACDNRRLGRCGLASRGASQSGIDAQNAGERIRLEATGKSKTVWSSDQANLHPECESMVMVVGLAKRSTNPILEREIGA